MPRRVIKTFKAWSYSRLTEWEQCPFRAKSKHLDKVKEPEGPALARGRAIEEKVYSYIFDPKVKMVPDEGKTFDVELAAIKKIARSVLSNRDLAFDRDWRPCAWDDWQNAWLRVRMDLLWASGREDPFQLPSKRAGAVARVADLKTGRIYEDKLDQLDLYRVTALLLPEGVLPPVDLAASQMWYLDQGETRPDGTWASLVRSQAPRELQRWAKRVKPMMLDEAFLPRPGNHCKWCHLAKAKGGPCPY